ncbi:hypothetical protein C0989_006167 [Termitomyces sp. Mn162]|nr:hypothetical protein C0989_006167 [Termitomyces sp. Mn162]
MVLPTLINNGTSGTFVSNQLNLHYNNFNKPLELQLFDGSPTSTGITQYHDNTLTHNNNLKFQVWLLITQLFLSTPIMLGLSWLQDINPNIDWRNLTMQFPGPKTSLDPPDNPTTTLILAAATPSPTLIDPKALNIKIISAIPFTCILQNSTPCHNLLPGPPNIVTNLLASLEFPPNALSNSPNHCTPSAPTLGNSDTSPANPDGPLANSNAFSAAVNAFLDSPEPLGPSPIVPDSAACHQLLPLVCLTNPGAS